ncbi:MAG: hypothetical protein KDB71_18105 [Mycobacterium sp.]|nr:hypothetical protein [Mycobacterium sp.]
MTIRLATRADIPAIMALETRYYVDNIDPSERDKGFISNLQSQDWFNWAVSSSGIHVAVNDDDAVVGFIAVTAPPDRSQLRGSPIAQAVLDLAETLDFQGKPVAHQRFALRGPVCVDESARGRGIYNAFNEATQAAYRDRFDVGVLFVAADNPRSLHTTTTKLGATSLAVFEVDSHQYHFMAFSFRS